jgi:subtilisin family serine protease
VHALQLASDSLNQASVSWPSKDKGKGKGPKPTTTATGTAVITTQTSCTGKGKNQKCTTQTSTSYPKPTSKYINTGYSNLPQIQADRIQALGNKGKGVKIGIIDSGVDYTRTPLGGCFGPGCKIAGGYDFVGDDYDGTNDPVPDDDPFDNCYPHGTFVAGIIGANDNEYNVTGVAPEASLYQYRIFGCTGASSDDLVIMAMQRAFNDGVDVINLSLGE